MRKLHPKFREVKPPTPLPDNTGLSVFLAGSIEMGLAPDWQKKMTEALQDLPITVYNPRRDDWDSSWVQSIDNPQFREQVEWELEALDRATIKSFYIDPLTKSPITLMELGLHVSDYSMVCCPEGFWRKGNVDIVCKRFGILTYVDLNDLIDGVRWHLIETLDARYKGWRNG